MKRNPILFVLLAILIVQPLLVVGFGPTMTTNTLQPAEEAMPSAGTRLTPEELTNHVPVLIYDNDDFSAQGWPGSGTPADPYVIAGLNITYDAFPAAIFVQNVDASFVIRDCYIEQLSWVNAIEFINTTAGTIEYTTIFTNGGGIYCFNADGTHVTDSIVADNELKGELALAGYSFGPIYTGIKFISCHDVTADDFEIYGMDQGLYAQDSLDIAITGATIEVTYGYCVYLTNSNDTEISDCTLESPGNPFGIIYTTMSEWLTITGNALSNSDHHGILISGSNNSVVSSNTITDCSPNGILVGDSHDCTVSSNAITGSDTHGIEVSTSHGIIMNANDVSDTDNHGIFIEYSDDGTLSNSMITEVSDIGAYFFDCDNWQIHDNVVSDAGEGIVLSMGSFSDVWSNDISDIDNEGFNADTHGMLETWENTVTNAEVGFYYTTCDDLYVRDETATGCEDGFHVDQSANSEFSNNVISECTNKGFNLVTVVNTTFFQNTLTNCEPYGFYIEFSENLEFTDNILTEGGFYFPTGASLSDVNHTFSGNTVNDLPVYYELSAEGLTIDGDYGQIILVDCNDSDITGGEFDKSSVGIFLHSCEEVTISDVQISEQIYGIVVLSSENITVQDSNVTEGLLSVGYGIYGIYVFNSVGFVAENVEISMIASGLRLGNSYNATIDNCLFHSFDGYAIYSSGSYYGLLIDSEIFWAEAGIYLLTSLWWNVTSNHIYWCEKGIQTNLADNSVLNFNDIHDCTTGVYWVNTWVGLIYNNTIRWNNYGIRLLASSVSSRIYFNIIALNQIENANDDTSNNWDNWVDTGNYWDDYDDDVGPPYPIPGSGGAVDHYPMEYDITEPIISNPSDVTYAEGLAGHEVTWFVYDDYLNNYAVTKDGSDWISDLTPDIYNPEVTVNIDGLSYGEHTIIITFWDVDHNLVSDTVLIDVYDNTLPTIDTPPNFEIFYEISGNNITWTANDLNPDNYVVWMDDSEFASGSWTSGEVSVNLDGLSVGEHEFTMVVYDADENSADDSVSILVIDDDTDPTIDSPEDIVFYVGSTGNSIVWTPSDEYPDRFEVTMDDTVVAADSWGGGRIILNLDHLENGNFTFIVTVWDGGQSSASDTVSVEVISYAEWTPDIPPPDFMPLIIAGAAIGGVIVVIGLIYYFKIKKPKAGGA